MKSRRPKSSLTPVLGTESKCCLLGFTIQRQEWWQSPSLLVTSSVLNSWRTDFCPSPRVAHVLLITKSITFPQTPASLSPPHPQSEDVSLRLFFIFLATALPTSHITWLSLKPLWESSLFFKLILSCQGSLPKLLLCLYGIIRNGQSSHHQERPKFPQTPTSEPLGCPCLRHTYCVCTGAVPWAP